MVKKEIILLTGASGRIGKELTRALRDKHGTEAVIATDLIEPDPELLRAGPYLQLNVMQKVSIEDIVSRNRVTAIYHLAAVPCAEDEKHAPHSWQLNVLGLLNVLDVAKIFELKVFWPSSIAVFGASSPKQLCPQRTVTEPATLYGIVKSAGEHFCHYYYEHYGVDVRSVRFPGLIGPAVNVCGGIADYANEMFYQAVQKGTYDCFLKKDTMLPMMYMPDAVRAVLELMEAEPEQVKIRTAYNISAMSVSPKMLAAAISSHLPDLQVEYIPDARQSIAGAIPASIDHHQAVKDWGWRPRYDLAAMTEDMLNSIKKQSDAFARK